MILICNIIHKIFSRQLLILVFNAGAGENSSWLNKSVFNFSKFERNDGQNGDALIQKSVESESGPISDTSKSSFSFLSGFNKNNSQTAGGSPKATGEDASDEEKDSSVVSNDHDPYFEPVVPLPKIVETKTGEEDETIGTIPHLHCYSAV